MDKATAKFVKRFEYTVYSLISRNKGNIKCGVVEDCEKKSFGLGRKNMKKYCEFFGV